MQKINYMAPIGMSKKDIIPHIQKEEKVSKTLDESKQYDEEDNPEWEDLPSVAGKLNLGLSATINVLMANPLNANNKKKRSVLEKYQNALYNGITEERIAEDFLNEAVISGLDTPLSTGYDSEISKLRKRIENNKVEINLLKILETMSETNEAFIVPLIEDAVVRYVKHKNAQNRALLRQALDSFTGYEFVQQMIEAIELDKDIKNYTVAESFISTQDNLKLIRESAVVSDVYSPVDVIKESAVFNVNGVFYSKFKNSISKLSLQEAASLNESFVQLCNLVNDDRVIVNENHIDFTMNGKHVKIYEDCAEIEGNKETAEHLRNIAEMQMTYGDYDTNFWMMCSCLLENYDKIANIDFVKHITLKNDESESVDLFKLNENLYVAANSEADNSHVLYKNLNPIQCANVMNEHLGIAVSNLFEDLMPAQDKVLLEVADTQKKYEDTIAKYDDAIAKLQDAKNDADSKKDIDAIDDKVTELEKSRQDVQDEYDAWQAKTSKMFEPEADGGSKKEEFDEPMTAAEAEDVKDELSVPLTDDNADIPEDIEASDDEDQSKEQDEAGEQDYDEFMNTEISNVMKDSDWYNGSDDERDEDLEDTDQDEAIAQAFADETSNEDVDKENSYDTELPVESEKSSDSEMFKEDIEKGQEDLLASEVVDVTFNENVKTGEKSKDGIVLVKVPSIAADGTKVAEVKSYAFTVDNNNEVIVENDENVSAELYNAIVDAIKCTSEFNDLQSEEIPSENPDDYFTYEDENKNNENGAQEGQAEEIETPSYDDNGTIVDMPAASEDPAAIHESLISIKPVYKKLSESIVSKEDVSSEKLAEPKENEKENPLDDPDYEESEDDEGDDIIESHYYLDDVYKAAKETFIELTDDSITVEDYKESPIIAFTVSREKDDDFDEDEETNNIAIYCLDGKLYYRSLKDFEDILKSEDLDEVVELLKKDYDGAEEQPSYNPDNIDGIKEMIGDILASLGCDDSRASETFDDNIGLIGDESKLDKDELEES